MTDELRIPVLELPGNSESWSPFDPAKLIALAKALKDEIEAQDWAMGQVADVALYDDVTNLLDPLDLLIAHCNADMEGETLAEQRSGYCDERRK